MRSRGSSILLRVDADGERGGLIGHSAKRRLLVLQDVQKHQGLHCTEGHGEVVFVPDQHAVFHHFDMELFSQWDPCAFVPSLLAGS